MHIFVDLNHTKLPFLLIESPYLAAQIPIFTEAQGATTRSAQASHALRDELKLMVLGLIS